MYGAVEDRGLRQPTGWSYVVCYSLYAAILVLGYVSFWTWRSTVEVVAGYFYRKGDAFEFVYLTSTLGIGLVLFVLVVGSEGYLRGSLERVRGVDRRRGPLRRMAGRFMGMAVPLVLAMFVAFVLQECTLQRAAVAEAKLRSVVAGGTQADVAGAFPRPPDTQERGTPTPGPWIVGAGLATAGTVLLAMFKRPK